MLVSIIAVCRFVGEPLGDAIRHPIEDRCYRARLLMDFEAA